MDMGFLVISEGGDGLGLSLRLLAEGHRTSMWIRDPEAERRGEGLVEKGNSLELSPILVADCTGSGALLDSYRNSGGLTYNGSQIQDRLESDRTFSSGIFQKAGIREPNSQEFRDWDSAKEFVSSVGEEVRLVFKPGGKFSGNLPSYVSHDNDDMVFMLDYFKGIVGEHEPEFVLQEFIKGTCISTEVWCAQGKMLAPKNHTLERKQLMNNDLGPSGGCTGNVVWACFEGTCPLCVLVDRLKPFLEECSYTGCIDVNTVVSTDGDIYALEFTPRFGYDAFPAFLVGLVENDFGAFINDSVRGDAPSLQLRDGYAAGVRLSIPPWPSEDFHAKSGIPIGGLRDSGFEWFYPYEVSKQDSVYVSSGGWGILGVVVGHGSSIEEAFEESYKHIRRLRIPDVQYRTDLAEGFKKDITKLKLALEVALV